MTTGSIPAFGNWKRKNPLIPKLLKLPEDVVAQIQRLANKRARLTGERPNFSAVVRELLREALAATATKKK